MCKKDGGRGGDGGRMRRYGWVELLVAMRDGRGGALSTVQMTQLPVNFLMRFVNEEDSVSKVAQR